MQTLEISCIGQEDPRPIDVLMGYKRCLAPGSVRMRTYDLIMARAMKLGQVKDDPTTVINQLKKRMKEDIRETTFQAQSRLDKEYEALEMRGRTHGDFRSLFETKIEEMMERDCCPNEDTLCRNYLAKITDDLRTAVM